MLFALLAGIAGTTFGLVRAEERRAEAEQARQREAAQRALAEGNERKAVTTAEEERQAKGREAGQRAKAELEAKFPPKKDTPPPEKK